MSWRSNRNNTISAQSDMYMLYGNRNYKQKIIKLLGKFGISERDFVHMLDRGQSDVYLVKQMRDVWVAKRNGNEYGVMGDIDRGNRLAMEVLSCLGGIEFKNLLDVGCNSGALTSSLGAISCLDSNDVCGIDIESFSGVKIVPCCGFNFNIYDGVNIPYSDCKFEFVLVSMVLHHINPSNRTKLFKDIYRVLAVGGYLLVKEHDISNDYDRTLVRTEHMLYETVCDGREFDVFSKEFPSTFYPMSRSTLEYLCRANGFIRVEFNSDIINKKYGNINCNNTYYTLWRK